jgi:hypothetical protein
MHGTAQTRRDCRCELVTFSARRGLRPTAVFAYRHPKNKIGLGLEPKPIICNRFGGKILSAAG